MFLLKLLLGFGKFLRDFFLQNWKWLVPLMLLIGGFLWTKNHYYDLGRAEERAVWEQRLKTEREKNEKLSKSLAESVKSFNELVASRNEKRVEKEIVIQTRIDKIIEEKPIYKECVADQEILNDLNALKAMGAVK